MTNPRDEWRDSENERPTLDKPPYVRDRSPGSAHRIRNGDLPPSLLAQMEGPKPPDNYESNGATWAPDYVGGYDLRAASHHHDWRYERGGDEYDREDGDYEFFRNLRRCGLGHLLAGMYFRRVRFEGIRFFNYDDPPRGWAKWRLKAWCFLSRYVRF